MRGSADRVASILVVDDQRNMRTTLRLMLAAVGHSVRLAENGRQACEEVDAHEFDVVLTDLKMPIVDGIGLMRHCKVASPATRIIIMTAFATIENAVHALREGAFDYVEKPFREKKLLEAIDRAVAAPPPLDVPARQTPSRKIIGQSPAMQSVLTRISRVARSDVTVLITGESGTGKEMVARAIYEQSPRADAPFVPINCAAFSETLLESELFGHARGAFTGATQARKGLFEAGDGGTVFFDEIGEMPVALQAKLLRALQEGEVRRLGENVATKIDVRVIAATNQDLEQAVAEKRFREDLFYRLNVARVGLPPLRERRSDIPHLVQHFLEKISKRTKQEASLGERVMDFLMTYDFPGNIRELENLIEQGVALAINGEVQAEDVVPYGTPAMGLLRPQSLQAVVDRAEKAEIERVLLSVNGNRAKAAETLGLSPTTLWRRIKRLGIDHA